MAKKTKKKNVEKVKTLVLGSGLSSLFFSEKYLKKKKKIDIICPNLSLKNSRKYNNTNNHIFKILPPQMIRQEKKIMNFFNSNKIIIDESCKMFGSLEFGGLSNYWGLQIDPNIFEDIKMLKSSTQKKIVNSFFEIMKKLNLIGKFKFNSNVINNSIKNKTNFIKKIPQNSNMILTDLILGLQNLKNKSSLDQINEKKAKLNPANFFSSFLSNKNIKFHNFYVTKLRNNKNGLEVHCLNNNQKKIFITKKLVIGCGTIVTTKLILDYLNVNKEIKLNHHPRLFTLFFLKKNWKNRMIFQPPQQHLKLKKNKSMFTTDFRPGNNLIIDSIVMFKKYLYPFKFLLRLLRFNMLFLNTFLHPKYGNLFLRLSSKGILTVYSKNKKLDHVFEKTSKYIYNFFRSTGKIFPFQKNYFPGYGADFHYFGTIKINGTNDLSVNENCQLLKDKRIHIIDGSIFNFRYNKFPLGLILANARRVAKDL